MKRLRRTVTKEYSGVGPNRTNTAGPSTGGESGGGQGEAAPAPAAPMSFADEIRMKILRRHQALHPEPQEHEELTEI